MTKILEKTLAKLAAAGEWVAAETLTKREIAAVEKLVAKKLVRYRYADEIMYAGLEFKAV